MALNKYMIKILVSIILTSVFSTSCNTKRTYINASTYAEIRPLEKSVACNSEIRSIPPSSNSSISKSELKQIKIRHMQKIALHIKSNFAQPPTSETAPNFACTVTLEQCMNGVIYSLKFLKCNDKRYVKAVRELFGRTSYKLPKPKYKEVWKSILHFSFVPSK